MRWEGDDISHIAALTNNYVINSNWILLELKQHLPSSCCTIIYVTVNQHFNTIEWQTTFFFWKCFITLELKNSWSQLILCRDDDYSAQNCRQLITHNTLATTLRHLQSILVITTFLILTQAAFNTKFSSLTIQKNLSTWNFLKSSVSYPLWDLPPEMLFCLYAILIFAHAMPTYVSASPLRLSKRR